jgi:hypothetical protein
MSQDIYNIELRSWFNHGCQNALEGVEQYLESLGERCWGELVKLNFVVTRNGKQVCQKILEKVLRKLGD